MSTGARSTSPSSEPSGNVRSTRRSRGDSVAPRVKRSVPGAVAFGWRGRSGLLGRASGRCRAVRAPAHPGVCDSFRSRCGECSGVRTRVAARGGVSSAFIDHAAFQLDNTTDSLMLDIALGEPALGPFMSRDGDVLRSRRCRGRRV